MKKTTILFCITLFYTSFLLAQSPDDALRNGWFIPSGTARSMAIGGAIGALGGDITSNNINPAGIGVYKTKELVLSPGLMSDNNKFDYRGTGSSNTNTTAIFGASGIVLGHIPTNPYVKKTSSAFSISVNQLQSYNNHIHYSGLNNASSFSEQYLEELTRDNADTIAALSNYIFGSSLAFRTYLIDTVAAPNNGYGYKTLSSFPTGVMQDKDQTTSGGFYEISFAYASNMHDKLYIGGSFNVDIVGYKRDLTFTETDATNDPNNNFSGFQYKQNFRSNGAGANIKLGVIYRPQASIRMGFALHSPSLISFSDEIRASMVTNTEQYAGTVSESSDNLNNGNAGTAKYNQITPWRAIASFAYMFSAVADTHKQRGFISADVEYVNYRGSRFLAQSDDEKDYLDEVNNTIKDYYKGNVNIRLGGEIKFDPIALRLGGAYYGSPYQDGQLKANRIMTSGGIGYRNHGFFIDLTYAYQMNKDVDFPYRLNDKPNTYATWNDNRSNIILSFGVKL
jgi:hypothetical protein